MRPAYRVRQVVNAVNLSTLLGLAVAKANGATLTRGDDGLVVARGATGSFPRADAFTVGNVVIVRVPAPSPELLAHESRHATQWAWCLVLFLPLYLAAAGWSWARCGDHYSRNTFERRADLRDGGYVEHPTRRRARQLRG